MSEIAIKIEHVSKEYRLGAIGGGTLRGDLQSWWARVRGKEDPNLKLDQTSGRKGDRFLALDDVSFEVKKGEAVGIIGHNGAGKSTLLKLLSRVTAPTKGSISYNGRIASMLEVGTGFHPELTGRENVYMNGAILGMSKAEIDKKFDEIVAFAEMEKFIDTPVKRYSSGMYVKLAFSVAAHLDSEIMIMDEVLAVGDVNFQQKCLKKMRDAAKLEGRTVLYVSHNMNTIRQLCDRCIVLNHGKCIYQGDVDSAIEMYANSKRIELRSHYDVRNVNRMDGITGECHLNEIFLTQEEVLFGNSIKFSLGIFAKKELQKMMIRYVVVTHRGETVGTSYSDSFALHKGDNIINFELDCAYLAPNEYVADVIIVGYDGETQIRHDIVTRAFAFNVEEQTPLFNMKWNNNGWGNVRLPNVKVEV